MEQVNKHAADENSKQPTDTDGLQETHQSGEDIRDGARNEDQLDKIKEAVPEGGRDAYPELQAGAPPNTGDENLQTS